MEQKVFVILICLGLVGLAGVTGDVYRGVTNVTADQGGEIIEGVLGQPSSLNPLLAPQNDADYDIRALVHAGLLTVNGQGNFIPLLAESLPQVSEDLRVYTVKLRADARWQDGRAVIADDVIHTIKNIQNRAEGSYLRNAFRFVQIHKIDELTVEFVLRDPVVTFNENLLVSLVPAHIPQIDDAYPVGAGPYRVKKYKLRNNGEVTAVELEANAHFKPHPPYVSQVTFKFFDSQAELIDAYKAGEITSFGMLSNLSTSTHHTSEVITAELPQYLAVFLNPEKNEDLRELKVRQALVLGTNREEINAQVYARKAESIGGPVVGSRSVPPPEFNPQAARELLEQAGWQLGPEGLRQKDGRQLSLVLSTLNRDTETAVANILAKQWREIGVNLIIEARNNLQDTVIRPREYQALLFFENIGHDPDPYAFWHSSQTIDPGLNLSMLKNSEIDRVIIQARATADAGARNDLYAKFVDLLNQAAPAVFLLRPQYFYVVDSGLNNINITSVALPHERFSQIHQWYIDTNRVFNF